MKAEEREAVLDLVEGLVVRGYNRPGEIAKNVGISRNTAARYLRIVMGRITARTTPADREQRRAVLIESANEALRRAWAAYSAAMNSNNLNAATGALRSVLGAMERISKLSGLDSGHLEITLNQKQMDAATDALLATTPVLNAVRALRSLG